MWVVRVVPVTGLVHETLEDILERFVDGNLLWLKRKSRGTFMNTRVSKNTTSFWPRVVGPNSHSVGKLRSSNIRHVADKPIN